MILGLLEKAAHAEPSKIAVVCGEQRISYQDLLARVERCAAGLLARGIGEGDCVAALLPNCPEFVVAFFASTAAGAIFLPLNPHFKKEESDRLIEDAAPKLIISPGDALPGEPTFTRRETHAGRALYLCTSGSTATYRRVCCTQQNLYWEARNFVDTVGLSAADTILCTIPLFHSYGIGNCLLDAVYLGATLVILEPDPAGDAVPFVNRCHRVAELISEERVRFYPAVPYQFSVLASLPRDFPIDLGGVRLCVSSGDALPRSTFDRFLTRFGLPIRSLYGSTEAGSIAMNNDPNGQVEFGSLGPALANVSIDIRDGQVWVKSPCIPPSGYDNRGDLNRAVFHDGFYNTGDIGHLDHRRHLFLAGRTQSFVNIAGNKVDTAEVEDVLASCPCVREAAVVGVDVPRMGTLLKAVVVTEGPLREGEIQAFSRQKLAFYKVPRLIEARSELPRSAMGKILRSELTGIDWYLRKICSPDAARIVGQIARASGGSRRKLVASLVQAQVAAVLGRSVDAVPRDAGFIALGMDSFSSIELRARMEYLFHQELPATLTFDYPSADALTENLLELLAGTPMERA
jgi:long-chain acyl-CoA synthetase